jgi:uncharacterized transporter YbjL
MTPFFRGVLFGAVIEAGVGICLYQLLTHIFHSYLDSSPFLVEYPLIVCFLIAAYLVATKRAWTTAAGMLAGLIVLALALAVLLGRGGA